MVLDGFISHKTQFQNPVCSFKYTADETLVGFFLEMTTNTIRFLEIGDAIVYVHTSWVAGLEH